MTSEHIRIGSETDRTAESVVGSNERTNERTDEEIGSDVNHVTVSNARPRTSGFTGRTLAELLADDGKPRRKPNHDEARLLARWLAQRNQRLVSEARTIAQVLDQWADDFELADEAGGRWPVIRTGPREPIPWMLRLSIYRRDDYSCVECGFDLHGEHEREWAELDHCIPWSAGGPDDSDNLRLLCHWCNQIRSNHLDHVHARNYRPTTWWCFDCWSSETRDDRHDLPWRDGTWLGAPALVDDEQAPLGVVDMVFCAFCQHHSSSPYPLVGEFGRRLIAEARW